MRVPLAVADGGDFSVVCFTNTFICMECKNRLKWELGTMLNKHVSFVVIMVRKVAPELK